MKLQGKVGIVTGAGSGIGREIALHFGREGANVAVCDIDMDGAGQTVEMLKGLDADAFAVKMDVTSENEVNMGVDSVAKKWGRIDTLISSIRSKNFQSPRSRS